MNKLVILIVLMLTLNACTSETKVQSNNTSSTLSDPTNTAVNIEQSLEVEYNSDDLTPDVSNAQTIELSKEGVTITDPGTYRLTGTLKDGQITINASTDDDIVIILDNVDITNSQGSPLVIEQADKVILVLADDSVNTLSDGNTYVLIGDEDPNAALFSRDDLSITGDGKLIINGNYANGIKVNDALKIISGTIEVNAVNDGIKANDFIAIKNANITIQSQGDGIQAAETVDDTKGFVLIENGDLNIEAGGDGIQSETQIEIVDGTFTIISGSSGATISGKSIKTTGSLMLHNGTFALTSLSDDALHANTNIRIAGGYYVLNAADDGIHADSSLTIEAGTIDIQQSYEGIEGNVITFNGGDIILNSSDDGINTAGGTDSSQAANPMKRNDQFNSDGSILTINGGTITVNANGDGLDSNGDVIMNGGLVHVFGPTNNGNGALDYNGTFSLNGGTLLAVGSAGMAQNVSEATQNVFLINIEAKNGSDIQIVQNNVVLMTFTNLKSIQTLLFSSAELELGEVSILENGNEVTNIKLTEIITGSITSAIGGQKPNRP